MIGRLALGRLVLGRLVRWAAAAGVVLVPALVLALALVLVPTPAARAADRAPGLDHTFESLLRGYSMEGSDIAPVRQGPVTIHLRSPDNRLVVEDNRLLLEPRGDGTFDAVVGVTFLGKGTLVADIVSSAGTSSRLTDEVVLPRQSVRLPARLSFAAVPEGWEVTAHELPASVEVEIRSRMINSLVTLCDQLALLLALDCGGLDRSLERVTVPLPEPGSVFSVPAAALSEAEAELLGAYLETAASPP